jgi:MYXO-CTERM domain-containing protein
MTANGGSMPTDSMDPVVISTGNGGAGGAKGGGAPGTGTGTTSGLAAGDPSKSGCGCSVPASGYGPALPLAALAFWAFRRRRVARASARAST